MPIAECSDIHGPVCTRVRPRLTRIESQSRDKAQLVWRDDPSDPLNSGLRKAREAARGANEQGQCWASHDVLFANCRRPAQSR